MKLKKIIAAALAICIMLPIFATAASATGFVWEDGQAMPRFSQPADVLDAIDCTGLPFEEMLTVASLQGIVNRSQPRILLRNKGEGERDWWPELLDMSFTMLPSWQSAVGKYIDELDGLVIWNTDILDTANVATTIAGIKNALVVTPALAGTLSDLPVLADLRDVSAITDKLSAYRHLYNEYRGQYTTKTISGLVPDGHYNMRDLAVAVKSPVVWLDAGIDAERDVLKLFFDDTKPLDTFYTGWWPNEGKGISFSSSYGVTTVPSDFYLNYTVYSGMSREIEIPTVPAKPQLDNSKIYVLAIMSDGDNIQYDQGAMLIDRLWGSPQRGEMPIAWTASPVMLDAGPQLLNYYYKNSTDNDVLICGPSGLGYSTSFEWPDEAFSRRYGVLTNDYFERSAFNTITMWHEISGKKAEWFTADFPSLLGMTTQGLALPRIRHTSSGVPMVWLGSENLFSIGGMGYEQGTENIKKILTTAAKTPSSQARFYACQVEVWFVGVAEYVQLRDELEQEFPGKFEFVRPDHFMMLINESYNKPYNAALQKNTYTSTDLPIPPEDIPLGGIYTSGDSDGRVIVDGSFTTGWQSDGTEPYVIVDFGADFTLDRYVLKNAETNYLDSSLNSAAWHIEGSSDGISWNVLDTVTDNTAAISYRSISGTARYLRLVIDDPGADGIARIQELEVYGVKSENITLWSKTGTFFRSLATKFFNFFFDVFYRIFFPIQAWVNER